MLAALARAGLLGLDLARGRAKAGAQQILRQVAIGATVLLFVILAFGFGLAAFSVWLAREIGTVPALGFIGLGFLVIAGIVVGVAAAAEKRRKRPQPIMQSVKQEFVAAEADAAAPPAGSTIGAMGVVGLIAFLFARQLFRR